MNNPDNFAPYRRGIILINVAKLFGGKGPFHKISYVFYKSMGKSNYTRKLEIKEIG